MKRIAIFASGTGSNFDAIVKAVKNNEIQDAEIVLLVSDKATALAIQKAKNNHIPTFVFNPKEYSKKSKYEQVIINELLKREVDLIVLAGYMRLIGKTILDQYQHRIINIHPSLLPKYKGLDAVGQAMRASDTKTGVTIHYVDSGMDTGQIIRQESVAITITDTRESLEAKIHEIEHKIYKEVINQIVKELENEKSVD